MKFEKALELINKYKKCPECGNGFIGNGQGALCIDNDTFERSCKCGWSIRIEQKDGGENE